MRAHLRRRQTDSTASTAPRERLSLVAIKSKPGGSIEVWLGFVLKEKDPSFKRQETFCDTNPVVKLPNAECRGSRSKLDNQSEPSRDQM